MWKKNDNGSSKSKEGGILHRYLLQNSEMELKMRISKTRSQEDTSFGKTM